MSVRSTILVSTLICLANGSHQCLGVFDRSGGSPLGADAPSQRKWFDVGRHGTIGNGIQDDTVAMQELLDCIPDDSTVLIPQGIVVTTGPLTVSTNNFTLIVDGVLQALVADTNVLATVWPRISPLVTYGFSDDLNRYMQYQSLVYAANVSHLRITGNGIIDGRGTFWWDAFRNNPSTLLAGRPNLIQIVNSSFVEIDSVHLKDSPFWTVHPVLCEHVHIYDITIRAPLYAPNVDGIDPDSCRHVLIEHNDVSCGDDHIAIKAGLCAGKGVLDCTDDVWDSGLFETRNVTVRENIFRTGMGIAVGSESSGSIFDVAIYNNSIGVCETGSDTPSGCGWGPALHLKTTITRGGAVERISFTNNKVYNTSMFIFLEMSYQSNNNEPPPMHYSATVVQDIVFDSNEALGSAVESTFECSEYDACRQITVTNNRIDNPRDSIPWTCKFISEYTVHGNHPAGLEECMKQSMNGTALSLPA